MYKLCLQIMFINHCSYVFSKGSTLRFSVFVGFFYQWADHWSSHRRLHVSVDSHSIGIVSLKCFFFLCRFRHAEFGHHVSCESNEIAIGACSSGLFADCGGYSHSLKCCKMDEFAYGTCESHHASWGHHLSCPDGKFVETMCASPFFGGCNSGDWTDAECCLGYYNNKAVAVNPDNCSWQHGHSGENKWCVGDQVSKNH